MPFNIELTFFAQSDLVIIGEYYLSKAGVEIAQRTLQNIQEAIEPLAF